MLVAITFGTTRILRIITMPYQDILQAHGFIQVLQGFLPALLRDNVIPGNMGVACVNTCSHRTNRLQILQQLAYLLERSTE